MKMPRRGRPLWWMESMENLMPPGRETKLRVFRIQPNLKQFLKSPLLDTRLMAVVMKQLQFYLIITEIHPGVLQREKLFLQVGLSTKTLQEIGILVKLVITKMGVPSFVFPWPMCRVVRYFMFYPLMAWVVMEMEIMPKQLPLGLLPKRLHKEILLQKQFVLLLFFKRL